jgi:hypothetical protein
MSVISTAIFRQKFPLFNDVEDANVFASLSIVDKTINPLFKKDPEIYEHAACLLVAHELTLQFHEELGLGAFLRTIEEGRNFHKRSTLGNYYKGTAFGLNYLMLVNQVGGVTMRAC